MDAALPLLNLHLWLRFLVGAIIVIFVPGYLFVGRYMAQNNKLVVVIFSLGFGLLLVPLIGFPMSLVSTFHAWVYIPSVLALGLLLAKLPPWRAIWTSFGSVDFETHDATDYLFLGAACLLLGWITINGCGQVSVPLGDGANHAFLAWRIDKVHSFLSSRIFSFPVGDTGFSYFAGMHAACALISQSTGVAPWVVSWQLPIWCLLMLPISNWVLWRTCGFSSRTAAMGSLILAGFHYFPVSIFVWSGFGSLMGYFQMSVLVALIFHVGNSQQKAYPIVGGVLFASMWFIHASEAFLALVVGVPLVLAGKRNKPDWWRDFIIFSLALGVLGWLALLSAGTQYGSTAGKAGDVIQLFSDFRIALLRAPHSWFLLRMAILPGIILTLASKKTRSFALIGVTVTLAYFWLYGSRDPVILALSRFFYQESPRIRYALIFFVPIWIAACFHWVWTNLIGKHLRWASLNFIGLAIVLVVFLWSAPPPPQRYLNNIARFNSFDPHDYAQAVRLRDNLPPGSMVANLHRDGSFWAMHVSRHDFYRPAAWPMKLPYEKSRISAVLTLQDNPWPDIVSQLQKAGVTHLYVSDTYETQLYKLPEGSGFTRDHFKNDRRFDLVDDGENASLFRINWLGR